MGTQKSNALLTWRRSKTGSLIWGIIALAAAYVLGSRAIDTGSLWQYLLTIVLLIDGIQSLIRTIRQTYGSKK